MVCLDDMNIKILCLLFLLKSKYGLGPPAFAYDFKNK